MSLVKQLLQEFSNQDYTPTDVMSKVSSLGKKATVNDNVVKFGLQDSSGNVVMVYVDTQQAEEFEYAMSRALNDLEDMDRPEIAELLFNMHQQFNIVNVEWPQVVEDEEEGDIEGDQTLTPEDGDVDGDDPVDVDGDDPVAPAANVDATSALDAIIQMMAADSEAKRQEALARAAEAKAREAEAAAKIVDGKLRAEEEVADMEAFYDAKQQEQKEAKKLAKLAKYRHDVKDTEAGEDIDDYNDALASQNANRESDNPLDASMEDETGADMSSPAVDLDSKDVDMENEESDADGPDNINRKFKEVEDVIRYLQSLPVQKAASNS